MTKTMTFNGIDMSRFFRIREIIRPIGNRREVETDDAPRLGVNTQRVKRGAKEHIIKFDMKTAGASEMEALKHELAGVLDVVEPVRIVYGDEPDKYYMGLPVEDVTPEHLARWFQRSELTLLIPDGVAHGATYREFTSLVNATVSGDKLVFSLSNKGTVPAYPIVTIKHNAENGYIGLVNAGSVFELGNREEVGEVIAKQSELLFDYRDRAILTGFTQASKNSRQPALPAAVLAGRLATGEAFGRSHVRLADPGFVKHGSYAVASLSWSIPSDSNGQRGSLNDYIWWRQVFMADELGQYGFIRLEVTDEAGAVLYGVETYKGANGLECYYNFFASDGAGGVRTLRTWSFLGSQQDEQNPFTSRRGWSDIKRNDNQVQVGWFGAYPIFTIPEIGGRSSSQVHVIFGSMADKPVVGHMFLESILYRKDFVPVTKDIPNRFSIGSRVVINSEEDTVYIDGVPKLGEVVDGSRWLSIPPGESQLELYVSSFVKNKPSVQIAFEERWL